MKKERNKDQRHSKLYAIDTAQYNVFQSKAYTYAYMVTYLIGKLTHIVCYENNNRKKHSIKRMHSIIHTHTHKNKDKSLFALCIHISVA